MKAFKIWWLKRRAKSAYLAVQRLHDTYDCGSAMIDHITSGRYSRLARTVNDSFDAIRELGGSPPSFHMHVPADRHTY